MDPAAARHARKATKLKRKRALLILGAGASLEFGAPSTQQLTRVLRQNILEDSWMQHIGGDRAHEEIRAALESYYVDGRHSVTFEQIYHCAHELLFAFPPTRGAVNEYRPALFPFLERKFQADQRALRALIGQMAKILYVEISAACSSPDKSLVPLAGFLDELRRSHVTRIYTTNYDDFVLQAAPDLFTGFDEQRSDTPKRFDGRQFQGTFNRDCLLHLHGSVHMGFSHDRPEAQLGELFWYDDREEALRHATYSGSGKRRMDGTEVEIAAVITGLDKLWRLQQRPLSYFYSGLAEDAVRADLILIVGCGLGDLHLNNWLTEARLQNPRPPIVIVDYWPEGFSRTSAYDEGNRKLIDIWHALRLPIGHEPWRDRHPHEHWTVAADASGAVWDNGFAAFLDNQVQFTEVLETLSAR